MKILIAYDGSGYSHNAMRDLRRACLPVNADVLVLSVSEVWLSPQTELETSGGELDDEIRAYFRHHADQMERNLTETNEILTRAKEELQNLFPSWTIKTEFVTGSPAKMILERSGDFAPDLIVAGSRGLSCDREDGLGCVSQKLLSYSPFAVRIGREISENDPDHLKIGICFDGSATALQTVKAVTLRDWPDTCEFGLFVATDPIVALVPGRAFHVISGFAEDKSEGEVKWVGDLTERAMQILKDSGFEVSIHVRSGDPGIVLAEQAKKWGADTVFVGRNSGRSNMLGCVAAAIAARSFCSVEVIPEISH